MKEKESSKRNNLEKELKLYKESGMEAMQE